MSDPTIAAPGGTTSTPAPAPAPAAVSTPAPAVTTPAAQAPPAAATPPVTPAPIALKLPEGSFLDSGELERTTAEATASGLSQEAAQKLLESKSAAVASVRKSDEAKFTQLSRVQWVEELKADKDFGLTQYDETVKFASKAFEKFGDADLKKALNETGYGNFPSLVRWAARVGRAMSEDGIVRPGGGGPSGAKSLEETFYGGSKEQVAS